MSALSTHSFSNKSFPKSSTSSAPLSSFSFTMKILLVVLLFLTINVAADGRMAFPNIRNDFKNATLPAKQYPCGTNLRPGKVTAKFTTNQTVDLTWLIIKPLEGTCFIDLSTTGKDTAFKKIATIPNCGDKAGKFFHADVKLPKGVSCKKCTLRFRWIPSLSKDIYLNCADVSILPPKKNGLDTKKRCHTCG